MQPHFCKNILPRIKPAALFLLILTATTAPVVAQSESIVQELQRLRRDLSDIQRFVYQGNGKPPAGGIPAKPRNDTEAAGRLQRQILDLQAQMRDLTGHIERMQHDVRNANARLDKLVSDVDIRLQNLEGTAAPRLSSTTGTSLGATPVKGPGSDMATVISSDGVTRAKRELAVGQGSLGRISETDLVAAKRGQFVQPAAPQPAPRNVPTPVAATPPTPPKPTAAPAPRGVTSTEPSVARAVSADGLPEGTAQQQYAFAFGKLKQRDYDEAETALRAFIERHPEDPLAGNAMYWMGETYYVRKSYPEAARIFLDAYQRFPKGNKAPDNLFKLAKSLVQIGETSAACQTYVELVKTFPNANARILSGAQSDIQRLGCG